jgi:outer membrane immunogenic protein
MCKETIDMKCLLTSALLALVSTSALAADLTQYPVAAPAFTWSGPYLGVHGGGAIARGDFGFSRENQSEDFKGGIFGGFAGYNYQFGSVVAGLEANVDYNWNDKAVANASSVGTDWSGAVRARLGYAFDNILFYGAGGATATRGFAEVPGSGDGKAVFAGWTVGTGVDYAFANNIFGRAEYRYSDFGSKQLEGVKSDFTQQTVNLGIGLKF